MNDNQDNSNNTGKKPETMIQILMGFGISLAAYALTIGIGYLTKTMAATSIIGSIILALFAFLIVRFFRTGYKTAAITMLIFISPLIASLLLFGACALIMLPF
jgi:hypothetical protein